MIGHLLRHEIEELLHTQMIGRLACHDKDYLYVVPISYAYEDDYIYCHSYEGRKLQIMRRNPGVCFQVDELHDMANWKSVIAWGEYEELLDEDERNKALQILLRRPVPITSSITTHLGQTWPFTAKDEEELSDIPGIVFRIALAKKSGKYEKTSETPAIMY